MEDWKIWNVQVNTLLSLYKALEFHAKFVTNGEGIAVDADVDDNDDMGFDDDVDDVEYDAAG